MQTWKTALTRAITAEVAAEKAAVTAEEERRRTWWDTTWALAAAPRAGWGEALAEYTQRTGRSKSEAEKRRRAGERLSQTALASGLPLPRFALEASDWIGRDGDEDRTNEALRKLRQAEKEGMSSREFATSLTGSPRSKTPEGMTEDEQDAVVEHVAKQRPTVVAQQATKPAVAKNIAGNAQASSQVIRQRVARTKDITDQRKAAAAANPTAAAQTAAVNDAVDAAGAMFPSNSALFNAIQRFEGEAHTRWLEGIRKQMFTDMDRAHMAGFHARLVRFAIDVEAFATAQDDPYAAVEAARAEYEDEFNREMDAAEAGMADTSDLDAAVDEIERFANEGV